MSHTRMQAHDSLGSDAPQDAETSPTFMHSVLKMAAKPCNDIALPAPLFLLLVDPPDSAIASWDIVSCVMEAMLNSGKHSKF